jgi:hypothetical protein
MAAASEKRLNLPGALVPTALAKSTASWVRVSTPLGSKLSPGSPVTRSVPNSVSTAPLAHGARPRSVKLAVLASTA